MTKPTIEDLIRLHTPPPETNDDPVLAAALDELERLRRLETTAKATYEAFKQFQYSVHMGDVTKRPEQTDEYTITYAEMLRMREALADLERWFIEEECRSRGFEGCREKSAENGHCFCGRFRSGAEVTHSEHP